MSYDLIYEDVGTTQILGLVIVVKPERYSTDYLTRLATTISDNYCNDKEISVTIFDDKKAAKRTDMWKYLLGKTKAPNVRGFISVSRARGTMTVFYSSKRGNSPDENVLRLPI